MVLLRLGLSGLGVVGVFVCSLVLGPWSLGDGFLVPPYLSVTDAVVMVDDELCAVTRFTLVWCSAKQ